MKKLFLPFLILIIITLFAFIIRCELDHGIAPLPGKLIATIHFRGEPPENTQGIYLAVMPVFPPHAINELYLSPNSLPKDQDTVVTEMELPYGHYDAVSLWWYSTETKSNLADILALPINPFDDFRPVSFDITKAEPVAKMILDANWNKMNRNAAIEGTIQFSGPFPENTLVTAIAAYVDKPERNIDYLVWLESMDFSIEDNKDHTYKYRLPVRNGRYKYIAVFWLPERADLTDFKTVGIYEDPDQPGQAKTVRVNPDETITGIDIFADWSKIND